ncbi:MAG: phosphoesterase [Bryobacteraceae bacterium]|nr:phosphoesterase [Bryobacterales bacterium]NUN03905.1 phosphoesterase [Bryobacteraceae bacterium]
MRVRILYHDHCFDGAASAAFFSRFLEDQFHPGAEFLFTGMAHTASQIFDDALFDGDVNAIVDFKYSSNPKLTWWFDHHQSAFLSPEDAEHFARDRSGRKMYNPEFRSCTGYIAAVTREKFSYEAADLAELVKWADIIDGAQYRSAREAVELQAPALKLMLVIEAAKGSEPVQDIIRMMRRKELAEIIADPRIAELFRPLYERHLRSIDIIGKQARCKNGVIFFDLADFDLEGYNKFIPYDLFPDSIYTVSVSISSFRTKVSVGSNPWAPSEPTHNLASICERYGGGGHARVGAISFPKGALEQARKVAHEIVAELERGSE